MQRADRKVLRFVRALVGAGFAQADGAGFAAEHEGNAARLDRAGVLTLASDGLLVVAGEVCRPAATARSWLRRQMLTADPFAEQHRQSVPMADGPARLNLDESPLSRLATAEPGTDAAFLAPHQVAAGERVRALADRAQLQQRLTMSYSGKAAGKGARNSAGDLSDMAVDARRALADMHRLLPPDCAGVVMDVCGLLKGLQVVESERGWPRRSAKLVLRIGLDQLARHFGMAPEAAPESQRQRVWGERPTVWG